MTSTTFRLEWDQLLDALSQKYNNRNDSKSGEEYDAVLKLYQDSGLIKVLLQWMFDLKSQQATVPHDLGMETSKSASRALSYRVKGNDLFKSGKFQESLALYNISVNLAPKTDETYPLALFNRSAVLLKMNEYKVSIRDIDLSLSSAYPEKQWYKIYLRKAECFYHLGDKINAKLYCEKATYYLHKSSQLSKNSIVDIDRNISATMQKISEESNDNVEQMKEFSVDQLPTFETKNEMLEGASSSLELRYSEEFGRHIVTNKDIKRGDVLFIEKPFAFVSLPGPKLDNTPLCCENCLQFVPYPIPCSVCIHSQYCSEACRIEGWQRYHQWECAGSTIGLWPKIGIAHLALRVFLIASHSGFMLKESKKLISGNDITAEQVFNCMKNEIKDNKSPRGYQRTFHLLTNFEKMDKRDFKQYALTSILLTCYLRAHTDFFESHINTKLPIEMEHKELEIFVACLILRHLGQLVSNGHAITDVYDYDMPLRDFACQREQRLGTAIYPSVSMLNHSCEPNIMNSHFKDYLIVKATCDISKGSEVFNSYGPHYRRENGKKRRAELEAQYSFMCKCSACTDSDKDNFSRLFSAFLCQSCQGPIFTNSRGLCNDCRVVEKDIGKLKLLHKKSMQTLETLDIGQDLNTVIDDLNLVLQVLRKCLYKYHTDICKTALMIATLLEKKGEFDLSVRLIKENLCSIQYQFGEGSIEVAHELLKLAHVNFSRMNSMTHANAASYRCEALRIKKQITDVLLLFTTYYGPWTKTCSEMSDIISTIDNLIKFPKVKFHK